jgi:hypothetical protein
MKTIRTMIAVSLLFAATTAVFAQTENRTLMKVSIPFTFSVEDHTLPAGQYYVRSINPDHSMALVSANGGQPVMITYTPERAGSESQNSRLIFSKYGNQYFLTQVWTKGEAKARNPWVSKQGVALARNGMSSEPVIILAYAGR